MPYQGKIGNKELILEKLAFEFEVIGESFWEASIQLFGASLLSQFMFVPSKKIDDYILGGNAECRGDRP
jgi:hypothetical protein